MILEIVDLRCDISSGQEGTTARLTALADEGFGSAGKVYAFGEEPRVLAARLPYRHWTKITPYNTPSSIPLTRYRVVLSHRLIQLTTIVQESKCLQQQDPFPRVGAVR